MTEEQKKQLRRIGKKKQKQAEALNRIRRQFWIFGRIYDSIADFLWEGVLPLAGMVLAVAGLIWLFSGCRASEHITNGTESILNWFWK